MQITKSSALCALFLILVTGCTTTPPAPSNTVLQDDTFGRAVILGEATPVGSIMPYAGDILPTTSAALASQGWLVCDGAEVDRARYADLYRVIGQIHGAGNGRTTFTLPDYRGMFLRGVTGDSGRDPESGTRTAAATGGRKGNAIGSVQAGSVGLHKHADVGQSPQQGENAVIGTINPTPGMKELEVAVVAGTAVQETRPINAYVHYLIYSGIQPPAATQQ